MHPVINGGMRRKGMNRAAQAIHEIAVAVRGILAVKADGVKHGGDTGEGALTVPLRDGVILRQVRTRSRVDFLLDGVAVQSIRPGIR